MKPMRSRIDWVRIVAATAALTAAGLLIAWNAGGCSPKKEYGTERQLALRMPRQVWAVAPAINLSGQPQVDPLVQADLLYQQLQQVDGVIAIPVNRVAEVYAGLRIDAVASQEQAAAVCEVLGCDGLLVPTVTVFDPYDPPKMGVALQLFLRAHTMSPQGVSPRELSRQAKPKPGETLPARPSFVQVVGMFDAANGSVRSALESYTQGRADPTGPLGPKEYMVNIDRYGQFVYHSLLAELVDDPRLRRN
jgi:hypothetical protein